MSITSPAHGTSNAFELKGEMSMWSVLQLLDADPQRVAEQLAAKVRQAPDFFNNMPTVIDLKALATHGELPAFPALVEVFREHGLVPIGIRNGNVTQNSAARLAGLALLQERRSQPLEPTQTPAARNTGAPQEMKAQPSSAARKSLLVDRPVRSGQQVYARDSDLVVVAAVSVGSELLADGHVHVYGPLRGRALAGVSGDDTTRIFCQSLEAELVAIAGHYQVSEELGPELKGKPVQIYLEGERLIIAAL